MVELDNDTKKQLIYGDPNDRISLVQALIADAEFSEHMRVAKEIFDEWKCPAAYAKGPISRDIECEEAKKLSSWQNKMESCLRCKLKQKYLGKLEGRG